MDPLSDVLRAVRLSGSFFFEVTADEPWVAETPRGQSVVRRMFPGFEHLISYHLILEGSCWATLDGEPPIQLSSGDIIVLPHGDAHALASKPGARGAADRKMYRRPSDGQLPVALSVGRTAARSEGAQRKAWGSAKLRGGARFVCGFLGCDRRPYNPLLSALPRVFRLDGHAGRALGAYFDLALAESREDRIGGAGVLNRISELMFVDAVRRYLESLPVDHGSWLGGLRDPVIGRALAALHREPARDWTLQSLAKSVALSRSALAERFTRFVGQPPMQYLAHWRMQLAANQLRSGSESIAAISAGVGYESEAAFSRAFKKLVGKAPGEWRLSFKNR
jgi:AraC-like DNA-binding protein